MEPLGDWIAPLAQLCLSSYQEESAVASLELEDDGSNLRFTNPWKRSAVVDSVSPL